MDATKQSRPFAELVELRLLQDLLQMERQPLPAALATHVAAQQAHCADLSLSKTAHAEAQATRGAFALRAFLLGQQAELVRVEHPGADRIAGGQSGDVALVAADGRRWRLEIKTSATASPGTDRNWGQRSIQPWLRDFDCAREQQALRVATLAALGLPATTDLRHAQAHLAGSPEATRVATELASPVLQRLAAAMLQSYTHAVDRTDWVERLWRDLHPVANTDTLLWVHIHAKRVDIQPAPSSTPPSGLHLEAARTGGDAALELVTYDSSGRHLRYRLIFSHTRGMGVSPLCVRVFRPATPTHRREASRRRS